MACVVNPNMEARANSNAHWYGAPGPLFCTPKTKVPKAPRWDYNRPWCDPNIDHNVFQYGYVNLTDYWTYVNNQGSCREYEGQKAGGWTFDGCDHIKYRMYRYTRA